MVDVEVAMRAIAEPRRRDILRLVRDGEMTSGQIASRFELTQPTVSHHLRVLREAGLVTERREGTKRFYGANPRALAELRDFLSWLWDEGLVLLKDAVEADVGRDRGD